MCAEVQILFLHKKQDDSVIGLQRFKLLGLGSKSNVAPKQNEIKKEGIASNAFQERSFFTKSHHLVALLFVLALDIDRVPDSGVVFYVNSLIQKIIG